MRSRIRMCVFVFGTHNMRKNFVNIIIHYWHGTPREQTHAPTASNAFAQFFELRMVEVGGLRPFQPFETFPIDFTSTCSPLCATLGRIHMGTIKWRYV